MTKVAYPQSRSESKPKSKNNPKASTLTLGNVISNSQRPLPSKKALFSPSLPPVSDIGSTRQVGAPAQTLPKKRKGKERDDVGVGDVHIPAVGEHPYGDLGGLWVDLFAPRTTV